MFRRRRKKRTIKKEMLINISPKENRIAIVEEGVLEEFFVEKKSSKRLVGNIYKGKVEAIVPGIAAAFVNIGVSRNGFLYLNEKHVYGDFRSEEVEEAIDYKAEKGAALEKGQEILVQVVREPIGAKGPRLTRRISVPGRYVVMIPHEHNTGISKRIDKPEERQRIRQMIASMKLPKDIGIIVRTEAEGMGMREFVREIKYLRNLWNKILGRAKKGATPSLIYEEYDLILRAARDLFTMEIDRIRIDSKEEYRRIHGFIRSFLPQLRSRVEFYRGNTSLFESAGIEKQINMVFERKVNLKSGGCIVIEPTEALTTIDVNTGHFIGKGREARKNPETTAFITNREAAREIARHIRLKDVGGIIVIDFIDMKRGEYRRTVLNELKEGVRRDKAKIKILNFSNFGLVEMTRQRIRKGVEGTMYKACPNCGGKGVIKED